MKQLVFSILLCFKIIIGLSQKTQSTVTGVYVAGYKIVALKDSSRIYKPNSAVTDPFHYRPLEIDTWYPAVSRTPDNVPMKYGEFVRLLQQRSNSFQDDTVYRDLTSELLQYLSINLGMSDTSHLAQLKTNSFKDAVPVRKQFPLIIYQCSYNGMSYENIPLFEQLASNGFIVACITSVGRYPGNMSTNPEDLIQQVDDGLFTLSYLKTTTNADSAKIGLIGYSWGGLAALVMAMENKNINAVLSLDGSEMFYYRKSDDESKDFNLLRKSGYFHPEKIHADYTYLESGYKQEEESADSIYNAITPIKNQTKYIRFDNAEHEDFSVIPSLALDNRAGTINRSGFYDTILTCSINFFNQYLNGKEHAFTETVNKLYQRNGVDSLYPVPLTGNEPSTLLKGKVIDANTKQPLAYVNLGVPKKNTGTVSRLDGSFEIAMNPYDSIVISMIGYKSQIYLPASHTKESSLVSIEMKPKIDSLGEVVVTAPFQSMRKLGNTTTSHFFNIGLPLKFLGSEIGVVISPGKNPALLKSFNFNVSENHLDSAMFRLNIYSLKNGQPFENILNNNILVHINSQSGPYHIDLTDYRIIIREDVLISLEWIDGGKSGSERGVLFLSAGLANSGTWHRTTSLGKWTKAKGLGVGFNVDVQPLMNKKG